MGWTNTLDGLLTQGASEIDAGSAAVIAAGMRAVALADGEVHERELALIQAFEAELPTAAEQAELDPAPGVREAYLRSLVFVALADGRISEEERVVIVELAAGHGFDASAVDGAIAAAKRTFLSVFAGMSSFRGAVADVARQLGVPPDEVKDLVPEA